MSTIELQKAPVENVERLAKWLGLDQWDPELVSYDAFIWYVSLASEVLTQ